MQNNSQYDGDRCTGRWSKEQHYRFISGIGLKLYGKNWKIISKCIQTRNCSQVRSHAQKYFQRIGKKQMGSQGGQGSLSEQISDQEEQTNISFSYYLSQITKFVAQRKGLSFWQQLIEVQGKKSQKENQNQSNKFQLSFIPYQKSSKDKQFTIIPVTSF